MLNDRSILNQGRVLGVNKLRKYEDGLVINFYHISKSVFQEFIKESHHE